MHGCRQQLADGESVRLRESEFQDLKAKKRDAFSLLYLKTFFLCLTSLRIIRPGEISGDVETSFFHPASQRGRKRGSERAKTDSLICFPAHPLIPFLQRSFTSFAESPSALNAVNLFVGSKQSSLCFCRSLDSPCPNLYTRKKSLWWQIRTRSYSGAVWFQQDGGGCFLQ